MTTKRYCFSADAKTSNSVSDANSELKGGTVATVSNSYIVFSGTITDHNRMVLEKYFHVNDTLQDDEMYQL